MNISQLKRWITRPASPVEQERVAHLLGPAPLRLAWRLSAWCCRHFFLLLAGAAALVALVALLASGVLDPLLDLLVS